MAVTYVGELSEGRRRKLVEHLLKPSRELFKEEHSQNDERRWARFFLVLRYFIADESKSFLSQDAFEDNIAALASVAGTTDWFRKRHFISFSDMIEAHKDPDFCHLVSWDSIETRPGQYEQVPLGKKFLSRSQRRAEERGSRTGS